MHMLRRGFASRPVSCYFILTFLISWSYWLVLLSRGEYVEPGSTAIHLPGLMGAMIATIIVTWVAFGKSALIEFLESAVILPRPRLRNIMLALSPVFIGGVAFLALAVTGEPLSASILAFRQRLRYSSCYWLCLS